MPLLAIISVWITFTKTCIWLSAVNQWCWQTFGSGEGGGVHSKMRATCGGQRMRILQACTCTVAERVLASNQQNLKEYISCRSQPTFLGISFRGRGHNKYWGHVSPTSHVPLPPPPLYLVNVIAENEEIVHRG